MLHFDGTNRVIPIPGIKTLVYLKTPGKGQTCCPKCLLFHAPTSVALLLQNLLM